MTIIIISTCILAATLMAYEHWSNSYTIKGDYIFHKRYGMYPKEARYTPGMTIYPGQSVIFTVMDEIPHGN